MEEKAITNDNLLKMFKKENNCIINPWDDDSIKFVFNDEREMELIEDVLFPSEFRAIKYEDKIEFIYGPVPSVDKNISRTFNINFEGNIFQCSFKPISEKLELLSKSFVEANHESASDYRNLFLLRDYFQKTNFFHQGSENFIPISFYVEGDFSKLLDTIYFAKIINFYLNYYQRSSPQIILEKNKNFEDECEVNEPCYSLFSPFPETINAFKIDPVLLDIFMTARRTYSNRLKFIFYYQILEYASYYFLNNKIRTKLSRILRDPSLLANINSASMNIIEEMKETFSQRDDYSRMEQTVNEYISISDIIHEIKTNADSFCKEIIFDGGLCINPIIKNAEAIDHLVDADIPKFLKNIEKIRNTLVHLRESRENKIVLPTQKNDELLRPYLYLLARISEKVALQFEY